MDAMAEKGLCIRMFVMQKIMSKIYTDNVEKARMLVKGVTENFDSVSSSGITIGAVGLKM